MMNLSTQSAAEAMLKSGKNYTASILGKELGVSAKQASGLLYNIRTTNKYKTSETPLPNRTVKVLAIKGRKRAMEDLWEIALRPVKIINKLG